MEQISATGFPLGMFPHQKFSVTDVNLDHGDSLLLYTDGVPEALNTSDEEYGMSRLIEIATASSSLPPEELVASCFSNVSAFRGGRSRSDDVSIMGIRRE